MTVTVDAATENVNASGGNTSFSHAGAASGIKGVVLAIVHGNDTQPNPDFSNVTYGGVALAMIQRNTDAVTEPGAASLWFLGSGVPQGTQTVAYNCGILTGDIHAVVITLLAADDTEIVAQGGINNNAANPSVTLAYSGRTCMSFAALYGGGASPSSFTPNANCTTVHDHDLGAFYSEVIRQTTAGSADFAIGGTASTDDVAYAAIAVSEVQAAVEHTTTGVLAGGASAIAGSASSATTRPSSGVLAGGAAAIAGTAARTRVHETDGVLAVSGAQVAGAASREGAGPVTHATSGALATAGAAIVGAASSATVRAASGVLAAAGAAVAGEATRMRAHATQGTLATAGAALDGAAARVGVPVAHATSGALTGGGSIVIGYASGPLIDEATLNAFVEMPLPRIPFHHKTSGRLVGKGARMSGTAKVTRTGQNRMALLMISV